jgi:cell division inhibitor SulA
MKLAMEKNMRYLVTGQLSLVIGLLCSLLSASHIDLSQALDFLSGAFIGLSMVLNLTFLVRYTRDRKRESQ